MLPIRPPSLTYKQVRPGDIIQNSLLRYRVLWVVGPYVKGVLIAIWRGHWQEPFTRCVEEDIHMLGDVYWERTPVGEMIAEEMVL